MSLVCPQHFSIFQGQCSPLPTWECCLRKGRLKPALMCLPGQPQAGRGDTAQEAGDLGLQGDTCS